MLSPRAPAPPASASGSEISGGEKREFHGGEMMKKSV